MGLWDWLTGKDDREPAAPETRLPAPPTAADILASLERVEALVETGVPAVVSSRVHRITDTVRKTLPRMDNLGLDSVDKYALMATATDYLPEAIGAYLRLPRDWADSRPVERGRSSLMLLVDQLDLLGGTMDKIYDAVNTADASALIAHGRFLQEKFGAPAVGGNLNLGAGPSGAAAPANPLDLE